LPDRAVSFGGVKGVAQAKLTINGKSTLIDAPADSPLLWAIRDECGLTGTKFGCGIGMCGACTVLVDGEARRSCVTTVAEVAGRAITTIEGLDPRGQHPVQRAWVEVQAPQCGYCQSGQILQACSLLAANPDPSDRDIDAAMQGNLCRCMAYVRIRKAIRRAAELKREERHG
jgi:isoquinoline 1-oxidoreductase alpha subunit